METGTTYKIQFEADKPQGAGKSWFEYRAPYSYTDKAECLNDLKAYRTLSSNKTKRLRAIQIEVTEID